MFRLLGISLISATLLGCGTAADHAYVSTRALCDKIANTPTFNVHRAARTAELRRRGANCDSVYDSKLKVDQNITIRKR